jgi:hypothetical protein
MSLDPATLKRLSRELDSPRLLEDARRLLDQIKRTIVAESLGKGVDLGSLHLSCLALQLPFAKSGLIVVGRMGVVPLRERAEQSAELLVNSLGSELPESVLDPCTALLRAACQKSPPTPEARVLADAVNLEDFGVTGLLLSFARLLNTGQGVEQLRESITKRDQYGYFSARIQSGFFFASSRKMADSRLRHMLEAAKCIELETAGE